MLSSGNMCTVMLMQSFQILNPFSTVLYFSLDGSLVILRYLYKFKKVMKCWNLVVLFRNEKIKGFDLMHL